MLRVLATAVALALLPAAVASADSLVYLKDGNVWVSAPDGSQARALTSGADPKLLATQYSSPSQADDGTVVALQGDRLAIIDRGGAGPTRYLDTIMTGKPAGVSAWGPFDPVISPDGTKIAYWVGVISSYHDYGSGYDIVFAPGDYIVYQDARTGQHLGFTKWYGEPKWLADSTRVIASEDSNVLSANVVLASVGSDAQNQQWFEDELFKSAPEELTKPVGDADLTRDESKVVLLQGGTNLGNGGSTHGKGNRILIAKANGFDKNPALCGMVVDAVGGEFGTARWSPKGDALAWTEGDGVWTSPVNADCGIAPKLTIPGARDPYWGPAHPADPGAAAPQGGQPPQQPQKPQQQPSGPAVAATLAVAGKVKRAALVRRGLVTTVTCPSACTVRATLAKGRKVVARATGEALAAGPVKLTLKARRKAVRRARKLTLTVRVTPKGGAAQTMRKVVRLR
ncbi:MAG: hypothetical protein HZB46_18385 [Solirubrobacterales bacterium]|nr:hypothetical protein [Solirubrobacterales bacterium]